jgi:hypothetical protein
MRIEQVAIKNKSILVRLFCMGMIMNETLLT